LLEVQTDWWLSCGAGNAERSLLLVPTLSVGTRECRHEGNGGLRPPLSNKYSPQPKTRLGAVCFGLRGKKDSNTFRKTIMIVLRESSW
jgi:hypothetical protein